MKFAALLFLAVVLSLGNAFGAPKEELKVEVISQDFDPSCPFLNVRVRLTNTSGNSTLRIIRPLPLGFEPSAPYFSLTLRDQNGTPTQPMSVCANTFDQPKLPEGTKWPEDFVVALGPWESFETSLFASQKPSKEGPVTISFQYIMPEEPKSRTGLKYPENVWHGTARAADVTIRPETPAASK